MKNKNIRRIATIEGSYARDTQIYAGDPAIIEQNHDWEDKFIDVKHPNLFIGVYEGSDENEIRNKVSAQIGVHPDVLTLVAV